MKQYKNYGTCDIDSRNYVYMAHFGFKVVSLNDDVTIFEDNHPFSERKSKLQVANVVVNENINEVIVMNFNGDFTLYKIIPESKKIIKTYVYCQRHSNISRCDVCSYWILKSGFAFFMDDSKENDKRLIRVISSNGSIQDYYYPKMLYGFALGSGLGSLKIQIAKRDVESENNIYTFNNKFASDKDIFLKRDDLRKSLPDGKLFEGLIKENDDEIGIFIDSNNDLCFKKYSNGKWDLIEKKKLKFYKPNTSSAYHILTKDGKFGIIEYQEYFCLNSEISMKIRIDFNNIKKKISLSNKYQLSHIICANDKYICIYSSLGRNSIIVLNIDELEDE